jgi:hypothetical protein
MTRRYQKYWDSVNSTQQRARNMKIMAELKLTPKRESIDNT